MAVLYIDDENLLILIKNVLMSRVAVNVRYCDYFQHKKNRPMSPMCCTGALRQNIWMSALKIKII